MGPDSSSDQQQQPIRYVPPSDGDAPSSGDGYSGSDAVGPADGDGNPLLASVTASGTANVADDSSQDAPPASMEQGPGLLGSLAQLFTDSRNPSGGNLVDGSSAQTGTSAGNGVGGAASILTAGVNAWDGVKDLAHGDVGDAVADFGQAGLNGVAGVGGLVKSFTAEGVSPEEAPFAAAPEATADFAGAAGGAAGVVGGIQNFVHGVEDYGAAKDADSGSHGIGEMFQGVLGGVGGGLTGVTSLMGAGVGMFADVGGALAAGGAAAGASVAGSLLAAGAAGVGAGMGMEAATTSSGMLTESGVTTTGPDGKPMAVNESGADKVADWGMDVSQLIDPSRTNDNGSFHAGGGTGDGLLEGNLSLQGAQSTAATAAGLVTTLGSTGAALAMDEAGTVDAGWNWLKSTI